jgi:hypothetical protein
LGIKISAISRIPWQSLEENFTPYGWCVSEKMSWAEKRQTTRIEDMAYSLLGLFEINMPLLYGEGSRAFKRLQEQIIRKDADDSIFAWNLGSRSMGLLARSPDYFDSPNLYRVKSFRPYKLVLGLSLIEVLR